MAAIICSSVSDLCRGTCRIAGEIISIPCRLCGQCGNEVMKVMQSGFCLYLVTAFALQVPPVIKTIQALFQNNGCQDYSSVQTWLLWNSAGCIANIVGALYIVSKIQAENRDHYGLPTSNPVPGSPTNGGTTAYAPMPNYNKSAEPMAVPVMATPVTTPPPAQSLPGGRNSLTRVYHVLMYDPGVAIYILVVIWFVIWQSIGPSRSNANAMCDPELWLSLMLDGLYLSLGTFAFIISLCCMR
jgi:hypothetical protein